MTKPARRSRYVDKARPARWIDVSADAATVHNLAREIMVSGHYAQTGEVTNGVAVYEHGTQSREFWFDVLGADLILFLMRRPFGWGRIVVFTEPASAASPESAQTRVTVSNTNGTYHAEGVHTLITKLVEALDQRGLLVGTSEPFSAVDLPQDSPGQPYPNRVKAAE